MQPRLRMILGTVCLVSSVIAAVIGLTLAFQRPPLVEAHPADQSHNIQRARRYEDGLHEFRSKDDLPGLLNSQISSAPFVSKYLNYTNASVTTDTNICSSVGMYVM